jgi:hypothetical protein
MISVLSIPRKYLDVIARSACPSCRWITIGEIPSRDISTACRVAKLMWREPATNARRLSGVVQLGADSGGRARLAARRASQNAEQRAGRQGSSELEPGLEVCPCPAVHPDLAPLVALAVLYEYSAAVEVQVGLVQREGLADSQPGAPQHHDHASQSQTVRVVAGGAHHGDDLLHGRRVGRIATALVPWREA